MRAEESVAGDSLTLIVAALQSGLHRPPGAPHDPDPGEEAPEGDPPDEDETDDPDDEDEGEEDSPPLYGAISARTANARRQLQPRNR
jgi:hypothetical protein